MASRNISLTPRAEDTRDAYPVLMSIQFSLFEIKQHFTGSMDEIKAQFAVADGLKADENQIACKMVWRSQVVLAEGLLDFYIHEISNLNFPHQHGVLNLENSIFQPLKKA